MNNEMDIYNAHFGLEHRPFAIQPDPAFLYWSPQHKNAYTMLEYGLMTRAPITLITGEVGAGKTTLIHQLLQNLPKNLRVGMLSNAHGGRGELLRWVLMALDQPTKPREAYVDLFDRFQRYLIDEYAAGNRVLLIVDEAQNLSRQGLEELRMFTNINANKDELLQLLLVGQPELREIIRRPELRQFAQRVSSAFHLGAMDLSGVSAYICHRMKVAGCPSDDIFTPEAIALIHNVTEGVPRLVNQICDFALVYTMSANETHVTDTTVQKVLDDQVFFLDEKLSKASNIVPVGSRATRRHRI